MIVGVEILEFFYHLLFTKEDVPQNLKRGIIDNVSCGLTLNSDTQRLGDIILSFVGMYLKHHNCRVPYRSSTS